MSNQLTMETPRDFANHIRHCIESKLHIQIPDDVFERDILLTLLGSNRAATSGMKQNMFQWQEKYFDLLRECDIGYEDIKKKELSLNKYT